MTTITTISTNRSFSSSTNAIMQRQWFYGKKLYLLLLTNYVAAFITGPVRTPRIHNPTRIHRTIIASTQEASTPTAAVEVVLPEDSFRTTKLGEVSIVSCNLLAPFYNSLAIDNLAERTTFAEEDRRKRTPLAMEFAKKHNADVLILQEVEGGPIHETQLQSLLQSPSAHGHEGYDSYLWSPLLPHRQDDVVGLCVAWRSNRHRLVGSESYKRGMVCQLMEVGDIDLSLEEPSAAKLGTFAVANVHLPARPSNVMGRLVTMSKTIEKLAAFDVTKRQSPLDGMLLVGGDFNCDQRSVTAKLLTTGKSHYGNIKDRNYKANISKASASRMRHGYRFKDVYDAQEALRTEFAPVTVSLHGRGPGCMDHLFFAQQRHAPSRKSYAVANTKPIKLANSKKNSGTMSKRRARREKAMRMRRFSRSEESGKAYGTTAMSVNAVLATVHGSADIERVDIIEKGLPNVAAGFPSDHLSIGALFVPNPSFSSEGQTSSLDNLEGKLSPEKNRPPRRGKDLGFESMTVRRRHNRVLLLLDDWLKRNGVEEIIRDQPLYKNPWTNKLRNLKKKSRAPDVICRIGKNVVIIEVTVVSSAKVEQVRKQKIEKYADIVDCLSKAKDFDGSEMDLGTTHVILLDDDGGIPLDTRKDIISLANQMATKDPDKALAEAELFQNQLSSIQNGLKF